MTILIFIIYYSKEVMESVSFSISIWKDNLFPSLFPFFIISSLLLQYGFVDKASGLFKNIMPNIFHLPKEATFAFIISLFAGFPSGAKATTDLVKSGILTKEEAARLLTFTHYANPLFILGFIGSILLKNQRVGIIILVSHIVSNLIIGFLFRPKYLIDKKNIKNVNTSNSNVTLGNAIRNSILDSLNTMFLLLGIVTIFLILTTIISNIFSFGPLTNGLISGILEMTQGVKNISFLSLDLLIKAILMTVFISFGGLSVHLQVLSIISEHQIKYKYFFLARILHAILASILVFILYLFLF